MKTRYRYLLVWTEQGNQMRLVKEVWRWWWPMWTRVVVEESCAQATDETRQT